MDLDPAQRDERYARRILTVLEDFQSGELEFTESVTLLQDCLEEISDMYLRADVERAWWTFEALAEKIATALEEEERLSSEPTAQEVTRLDEAARRMREALAPLGVGIPLWQLYHCRVCGADQGTFLPWGPRAHTPSYLLCSCCASEFGREDRTFDSALQAREEWVLGGCAWWDTASRPAEWDAAAQLSSLPLWWRAEGFVEESSEASAQALTEGPGAP